MSSNKHMVRIGRCQIHPTAYVCDGAIIGKPFRRLLDGTQESLRTTYIRKNTYIGYYSTIGTGCKIGHDTIIDDQCIIESKVEIGAHTLIIYRAQICNGVKIGNECIIGGFIGERTSVGDNCRIFGKIVHSQRNPALGWDDDNAMEESAVIENHAFIGFDALVIGKVKIGRRAYICAGAIITKDVPSYHIAKGKNEIVYFKDWEGALSKSPFFCRDDE